MAIENKDYLLRQIERLAELVAALVGGVGSVEMKEVARECERVKATLLGPLRDGFDRIDPKSAVMLIGGGEKTRLLARVLELEGDLHAERGDAKAALSARRQSLALLDALAQREPRAVDDAFRARVAALEAKVAGSQG